MKRSITYGLLIALFAACSTKEIDIQDPIQDDVVFYATFEQSDEADTKVYANQDFHLRWNSDDRVSIFNKITYNQQYRFTGETGDNAGGFKKVDTDEFVTGNKISDVVSVYPYQESIKITESEALTITLPAEQTYYAASTFGLGANTMVSVSEENVLQFKNVGGYLMFKLYGEGVSVSSISLKGNNGEKLAGKAQVTMPLHGVPSVTMASDAITEITLTCDSPVQLSANAEESSVFWVVVPPVTFSKGFTITVNDSKGGVFEKSTTKSVSIERNKLSKMSPIEVIPVVVFVPFEDDRFKAFCVKNFDTDGDGEISLDEAGEVTVLNVEDQVFTSLRGIEYFGSLTYLVCNRNRLTSLDLSNNTELTFLDCRDNYLRSLDMSNNTALTKLWCDVNPLTSLDVSKNTALTELLCSVALTSLDVSNNTALTRLICGGSITNLDVSKNTALTELQCSAALTSLDVSNNTALTILGCSNNLLTSLDVSNNTALKKLWCGQNQLTSLDVSKNTMLEKLSCDFNQLTSLNVSNNTALTELRCGNNLLTSLNVSNNMALTYLVCSDNYLSSLDVSNTSLTDLICPRNPYLSEIWLRVGQSIDIRYDTGIATIKYK